MMPWYFLQVKWKTQPYESQAKSQTRAFIDTRHQNTENWIETKIIMINRFSKGNRILFIDSHWYVPRENMFLFITQTEFNCQSTLSECRKNLPLIVRAQPRRYACFGSKPTYKKLINTKIRQNKLKSRPASRLQVKLRVEERPKPRQYKIWIGSHAPAELKDKLE